MHIENFLEHPNQDHMNYKQPFENNELDYLKEDICQIEEFLMYGNFAEWEAHFAAPTCWERIDQVDASELVDQTQDFRNVLHSRSPVNTNTEQSRIENQELNSTIGTVEEPPKPVSCTSSGVLFRNNAKHREPEVLLGTDDSGIDHLP